MTRTVVHLSDSTQFGGTEQALLHLLAALDRAEWRPVLYHRRDPGTAQLLSAAGAMDVDVRPLPAGWPRVARVHRLIREFRELRPAVVHAHLHWPLACRVGVVAARVARVPVVVATSQLLMDLRPDFRTDAQHRVLEACIDRYFAVSMALAQRLQERFGVPAHKIQVIPNAIDLTPFPDTVAEPRRGGDESGTVVVLTVARLDPQKDLGSLLAAAAQVPDATFLIAGEGEERGRLETTARELGLAGRVRFLGFRGDIPALLAACDLFVLPSRFEGLPLAVLEAMAAGRPVVATRIGGMDEAVVDGHTGVLVPPGDPAALASAIRALADDPARARRLGEAGRRRVRREFSADSMAGRVMAAYRELLAGRGFPQPAVCS